MRLAFGVICGAVAVYELAALLNRSDGDTISERTWNAPPIVAFGAGVVAGHLFWQRGENAKS